MDQFEYLNNMMKGAKLQGADRNYIPANTEGELEIIQITPKKGYTGDSVIALFVLRSAEALNDDPAPKVPQKVSSVHKVNESGKKGDMAKMNLATIIARALGQELKELTKGDTAKIFGPEQALRGFRLKYVCRPNESGKAFAKFLSCSGEVNTPERVKARRAELDKDYPIESMSSD